MDLVMFLQGRIATNDGGPLPNDALVERTCNGEVLQQVYATPGGGFSMEMGSKVGNLVDASGDSAAGWPAQDGAAGNGLQMGIPRYELAKCELRASASGFRPHSISLVDVTPSDRTIDVGAIVVQRVEEIKGMTLSATPYKAPPNARKNYEKGLEAKRNGKLAEAQKYFARASEIYPGYASAWFQLGTVLEKENQKEAARAAYTQATVIDSRFLPPYRSLASMAYETGNWTELLKLTSYILDLDPLSRINVKEYILDLDESNPAEVYFYNAVANFKLNKIEEAERSAIKAEHIDLRTNYPQLHLLLAEISVRKKDYTFAISELQAYLELAPHAKNSDQIREQLEKLKKLNRSAPTSKESVQN